MTQDSNATIGNAVEIINRFGGIRPMSTKTGIPVTTIQGWKQRNAIPANRRFELVEAANRQGIDLADLLMEIAGNKQEKSEAVTDREEIIVQTNKMAEAKKNPEMRPAGHQATMIAAGALILAAGVVGVILAIAPKVGTLTDQEVRIHELEQQIAAMSDAQATAPSPASLEFQAKISELEGKVGALTEQAKSLTNIATDLQTGTVAQRISKLEGHMGALVQQGNAQGLQNLLQRFNLMQKSDQGLGQLDGLVAAFVGSAQGGTGTDDVVATIMGLRETNPQVAETFKDVAPEDMKAAVMLLGMSQLRESLARDNNSFDNDLQLLKLTMAKDDPALQEAIDKLAPKAKTGILTTNGLSKELRGLTGEIVSASLTGQEISLEEKARARFGDVLKVEKNGEQISGTSTQITIAEAQKCLDAGDVEGAVLLLQQIQGPAAVKTKPIIDQAQATMLATSVQQLLSQNLVQKLKGLGGHSAPYVVNGGGSVNQVVEQIKTIGAGVVGQ